MAKIILKTSLANKNVSIPWVQVNAVREKTPDTVDVLIKPIKSHKLNALDISHGFLPAEIKSIAFSNSGKNVLAKVAFNTFSSNQQIVSVYLPLTIRTKLISNEVSIIESTTADANVLVEQNTFGNILSDYSAGKRYLIKGSPGQTIDFISKSFTVPDNYSFSIIPRYNIKGDKSRYKVTVSEKRNNDGKLTGKTFSVKYTFPKNELSEIITNRISFTAGSKANIELLKDKPVESKKDGKIYSVDTGRSLGLIGGVKTIRVKGIPGTRFKLFAENATGNVFNFKTGGTTDGSIIEGIIPEARRGLGFGEYKRSIRIPPSSTASAFNVRLRTDADLDHEKLAEYLQDGTKQNPSGFNISQSTAANTLLNIALKDGGVVDTSENPDGHPGIFKIFRPIIEGDTATPITVGGLEYIANGTYAIGKGEYKSSISTFIESNPISYESGISTSLSFLIKADGDSNFIVINRAPKFAATGYNRWDFATFAGLDGSYSKDHNSEEVEISSDWGTSIRHTVTTDTSDGTDIDYETGDWNVSDIAVSIEGHDEVGETALALDDPMIYSYVILTITDINGSFGKEDLTIELNLKNFLSTIAL